MEREAFSFFIFFSYASQVSRGKLKQNFSFLSYPLSLSLHFYVSHVSIGGSKTIMAMHFFSCPFLLVMWKIRNLRFYLTSFFMLHPWLTQLSFEFNIYWKMERLLHWNTNILSVAMEQIIFLIYNTNIFYVAMGQIFFLYMQHQHTLCRNRTDPLVFYPSIHIHIYIFIIYFYNNTI